MWDRASPRGLWVGSQASKGPNPRKPRSREQRGAVERMPGEAAAHHWACGLASPPGQGWSPLRQHFLGSPCNSHKPGGSKRQKLFSRGPRSHQSAVRSAGLCCLQRLERGIPLLLLQHRGPRGPWLVAASLQSLSPPSHGFSSASCPLLSQMSLSCSYKHTCDRS